MFRRTAAYVSSVALYTTLLGAGAAAAPTTWPHCPAPTAWGSPGLRGKLSLKACGPTKVVRGVNYRYTVLVTNFSKTTLRSFELSVIHYDPITGSSRAFRRKNRPDYFPMYAAVWTLNDLEPGQTFRVGIRLPFLQHNDPKGSNFVIEARSRAPKQIANLTKDVFFIRRSS